MKVNILICTLLTVFPSLSLYAQGDEQLTKRSVSVMGAAEVRVVPSRVLMTYGIESLNENLDAAKQDNDSRISSTIAFFKSLGVAQNDIQTDYIQIEPKYEDSQSRTKILHYVVRRTVVVMLRDVSKFETILGGVLKTGVNYVLGIQFQVNDLKKYRDEARAGAIKAAREKAQALASALDVKVGKVVSIQDQGSYEPMFFYNNSWDYRSGGMSQVSMQGGGNVSASSGETLALGQMSINAQIGVVFELE